MSLRKLFTRDFRHTAMNQLWRLLSGPALLILIPLYLSAEVQGYWFTFISLAALAVFADLGFTTIILQFSAHEFAHLRFDEQRQFAGNPAHVNRISSLFRFALGWSIKVALLVFPVILFVGAFVLSNKQAKVHWLLPWIIYGTTSVPVFINNIVLSFIEGCDSVGDAQKIRLRIAVGNTLAMMTGLLLGWGLYALVAGLVVSAVVGSTAILHRYRTPLQQLYTLPQTECHPWKKDILPLLGKYAVSWASGYFIFSVFTPLAFHYYGAVEAGRIGLSIALWTAIFGVSNVWITSIMPKVNMLIAKGDYKTLDILYRKHLLLSVGSFILGSLLVFVLYFVLKDHFQFVHRFVSPASLLMLALCWFFQLIINAWAVYMRGHKEEPLVIPSLVSGIYTALTTWLIAMYLPVGYFFVGFLSSYVWGLPWVLVIFRRYKGGLKSMGATRMSQV